MSSWFPSIPNPFSAASSSSSSSSSSGPSSASTPAPSSSAIPRPPSEPSWHAFVPEQPDTSSQYSSSPHWSQRTPPLPPPPPPSSATETDPSSSAPPLKSDRRPLPFPLNYLDSTPKDPRIHFEPDDPRRAASTRGFIAAPDGVLTDRNIDGSERVWKDTQPHGSRETGPAKVKNPYARESMYYNDNEVRPARPSEEQRAFAEDGGAENKPKNRPKPSAEGNLKAEKSGALIPDDFNESFAATKAYKSYLTAQVEVNCAEYELEMRRCLRIMSAKTMATLCTPQREKLDYCKAIQTEFLKAMNFGDPAHTTAQEAYVAARADDLGRKRFEAEEQGKAAGHKEKWYI